MVSEDPIRIAFRYHVVCFFCGYSRDSARKTTTHERMATVVRPFPLYARMTAAMTPQTAEITELVAVKTAEYVMTVSSV